MMADGIEDRFGPGDSFYAHGLKEELFFKTLEDTTLVYISTVPVFDTGQSSRWTSRAW